MWLGAGCARPEAEPLDDNEADAGTDAGAKDANVGDAKAAIDAARDAMADAADGALRDSSAKEGGLGDSGRNDGGSDSGRAGDGGATLAELCLESAATSGENPSDPCVVCGCESCAPELRDCYSATDVATGGPARGISRGLLCETVVECGRDSGCSGDTCYCGTASTLACLNDADGPCKTQLERAAESTSALTILQRKTDTTYAVGRANAVAECSVQHCATQCGL